MSANREFRLEMFSRRSEMILWVLTIISLATWFFLRIQNGSTHVLATLFVLFILFTAGSTSLSNWMDHKTVLEIKPDSVEFSNGLRNTSLGWDEIQEVRVIPSRFGKKVHILGAGTHFHFRLLSIVDRGGVIRSQMGFAAGDFILEQILRSSGLQEIDQSDQGRYYARP